MGLFSRSRCDCQKLEALVDVTDNYQEFVSSLESVQAGDSWVKLMRCPVCGQYWKVDEWDKYQALYAFKLDDISNWASLDTVPQIKERMIRNRGGLAETPCMRAGCKQKAIAGSAYCVDHLFEIGWRA